MGKGKGMLGLLCLCVLLLLIGCGSTQEKGPSLRENRRAADEDVNSYIIDGYNVKVTYGPEWEKELDTPFDLQCGDGSAYSSFFCYKNMDLAEGQSPMGLYQEQTDALMGIRDYPRIIKEGKGWEANGKTIYSELYTAEKDGQKNAYYCSLVEFNDSSDVFVWSLFTAVPSVAERDMDEWNSILETMELVSSGGGNS